MPERLRIVARAFKTFQQTDLQRLLFGFSADFGKQSLQFSAMRQIANFVTKTEHELTVLCRAFPDLDFRERDRLLELRAFSVPAPPLRLPPA